MKELLKNIFKKHNIVVTEEQLDKFEVFYKYLIEENEKFNLTAITDKSDFAYKHILDSVLPVSLFDKDARVIDIGAGAGFPSIPLKILRPDLKITMIDSLNKRVNFLNEAIILLKLENIKAFHFRAEDYVQKNRESFDIATARAVAHLSTLSEYLLPFVKVGGKVIAYKSIKAEQEITESQTAINLLGGAVEKVETYKLNDSEDGTRYAVVITKIVATNKKYPRAKNLPRLKPLISNK